MHLSRFTDYSLRTLFLVCANPERRVTLQEISGYYDISIDHLRKVVHHLAQQGVLQTFRGKQGGMCLARTPGEINLGALVRMTEGDGPLITCEGTCRITPVCQLTQVLAEAQSAFFNVLDCYTLEDLTTSQHLQKALLLPDL